MGHDLFVLNEKVVCAVNTGSKITGMRTSSTKSLVIRNPSVGLLNRRK